MNWNRILQGNPKRRKSWHERKWSAGVWEQHVWERHGGFTPWSFHSTKEAAFAAARKYARQQQRSIRSGGELSWAGGVRKDGVIYWVDGQGVLIRSETE